jgi:capsular exopolysaccharide synthesis family protein
MMKEGIYLILLQNRETAILNGAVLESNLKTISKPQTNYSPVFPKKKPFILGAFLFGLLLPFGIVYLRLQLDTKIHSEEDLLSQIKDVAFLGTIPQIKASEKLFNTADSRSPIAEVNRSLFSNMVYLLPQKQVDKGHVVLYSSSIKGEGKTFSAYHSALTISNLNKKVLLIGADLRNPQLHDYFSVDKNTVGLSNFLSNKREDWKGFLKKDANSSGNLDVLFAGPIPPNPSQLLTNTYFDVLIEEAKKLYDFIIIDSAPIQLVSDTLNFSYLADVTVFIVKDNFSDVKSLLPIKNLMEKGQLKNVGFVINGINIKKSAYGYNYGYNYGMEKEKQPWYKINK